MQIPMNSAVYKIIFAPGMVALIDENLPGTMTITNDAEGVVERALAQLGNYDGKEPPRIIYKDTMGEWAELGHDGHRFTGFKPCRLPNVSFSLTTKQFRNRTKTVTRRLGWKRLKAGQLLMAVEKAQGLKKDQHPVRLGVIRVKDVRQEPLNAMDKDPLGYGFKECRAEGFPNMVPHEFVLMFCQHNCCSTDTIITRIEFEYL